MIRLRSSSFATSAAFCCRRRSSACRFWRSSSFCSSSAARRKRSAACFAFSSSSCLVAISASFACRRNRASISALRFFCLLFRCLALILGIDGFQFSLLLGLCLFCFLFCLAPGVYSFLRLFACQQKRLAFDPVFFFLLLGAFQVLLGLLLLSLLSDFQCLFPSQKLCIFPRLEFGFATGIHHRTLRLGGFRLLPIGFLRHFHAPLCLCFRCCTPAPRFSKRLLGRQASGLGSSAFGWRGCRFDFFFCGCQKCNVFRRQEDRFQAIICAVVICCVRLDVRRAKQRQLNNGINRGAHSFIGIGKRR
mmetsp:Transcript_23901/g.49139  ORF Transcript_23901/g.49139 Transcript_23901/m.49139 type:complete len:305 (+) Transcript_23901:1660-2574(+)